MAYKLSFNGCLPDYETMGRPRFLFAKWDFSSKNPFLYFGVIYGHLGSSHMVAKSFIPDSGEEDGIIEIIPISELESSSGNGKDSSYQLYDLRDIDKLMLAISKWMDDDVYGNCKLSFRWVPEVMDYRMSWENTGK